MLLLYNSMTYPKQIYTGGAGEDGGFLEACCKLVFESWAESLLVTDTGTKRCPNRE